MDCLQLLICQLPIPSTYSHYDYLVTLPKPIIFIITITIIAITLSMETIRNINRVQR